jgi:protease I
MPQTIHTEPDQTMSVGDTALLAEPNWDLGGKRIAILATDGFEQSELMEPKRALEAAGAETRVVSPKGGAIRGWHHRDWGETLSVDLALDSADPDDFDALLLPGGAMNPDRLRTDADAVRLVLGFARGGKPIAAIGHGPWLLVEADLLRGRRLTAWPSLQSDIRNAGGHWVDEEVVNDRGLISSRGPSDLPAFIQHLLETLADGGEPRLKIGATDIS